MISLWSTFWCCYSCLSFISRCIEHYKFLYRQMSAFSFFMLFSLVELVLGTFPLPITLLIFFISASLHLHRHTHTHTYECVCVNKDEKENLFCPLMDIIKQNCILKGTKAQQPELGYILKYKWLGNFRTGIINSLLILIFLKIVIS